MKLSRTLVYSTFSEPHTVIKEKNKCLLCGGRADIGFAEAYSFSKNRVYLTEAGSYVLPNETIVLVEADVEDFLKGIINYLN